MMETAKICCAGISEIDGNGISIGHAAGMGHAWDGKTEENVRHGVWKTKSYDEISLLD